MFEKNLGHLGLSGQSRQNLFLNRRRQQNAGFFHGCVCFTRQALMLDNPEDMLCVEHTVLKKPCPCRASCPCQKFLVNAPANS